MPHLMSVRFLAGAVVLAALGLLVSAVFPEVLFLVHLLLFGEEDLEACPHPPPTVQTMVLVERYARYPSFGREFFPDEYEQEGPRGP